MEPKKTADTAVPLDELLPRLGNPGKYQVFIFLLLAANYFPVCFNHVIMAFFGSTPKHLCYSTSLESSQNWTVLKKEPTKCSANYFLSNGVNTTTQCNSDPDINWKFTTYTPDETTIITEWNLVCNSAYLGKLATTIYFCGVMAGGLVFGHLADFFGRKPVLLISLYIPIAIGVGTYFVESYEAFVSLRFFQGFFMQGLQTSTVALVMEIARKEFRGTLGAIFECYWGSGVLVLAGICYWIQDWRYIQLAICLPSVVTFWYYWVIPESPRWLIMNKKYDEAERVVKKIADFNKLPYPKDVMAAIKQHGLQKSNKRYTVLDLLKTSVIRSRTFRLFFMWFATSVGYYGLTFSITSLAGDKYLNFFIGAVVEMVAYVVVIYVVKRFGRRKPLTFYFLCGGISCILAGCIPFAGRTDPLLKTSTSFAIIGRFGMGGVFSVIVLYTSELYPTVARNIGLGSCFFWTRVGGLVAPQVILLGDVVHKSFPIILFGAFAVIGGLITLTLPETLGRKLPDTIEDAEKLKGFKIITDGDSKNQNGKEPNFDDLKLKDLEITKF